jgi:hypothetical protein
MFVLARSSRAVPFVILAVMIVAIPTAAVATSRPPTTIAMAFGVAIFLPSLGWLIRARSDKQQADTARRSSGAGDVFRSRLTRRSYNTLRARIFAKGLFYQAAMQVWLAVSQESVDLYCTGSTVRGKAVRLAGALTLVECATLNNSGARTLCLMDSEVGVLELVVSQRDRPEIRRLLSER